MRFFYAAPDRTRYEASGKIGTVQVADGEQWHAASVAPGSRAASDTAAFPLLKCISIFSGGGPFCYEAIHVSLSSIEDTEPLPTILRDEDGCHVISVTYEPAPNRSLVIMRSASLFWINAESRIRQQRDLGHRFPTEDEVI